MSDARRGTVVVLRALALGDFLVAIPAYRAIARAFPEHRRVLAAPAAFRSLAVRNAGFDDVVPAQPLGELDPELRGAGIAINLHGSGPQSHRRLLDLRPQRLLAFRNDEVPESAGGPPWHASEHEARRWCRLLQWYGVDADASDLWVRPVARNERFAGAVVLHPGAASESRRWPVDRWVALARTLRAEGYRVALTGTREEFRRCRVIAKMAGLPADAVFAGKTDLEALFELVAGACAVVCGDTGVAHVATAVRTPSVLLFGPTSPATWGPPDSPLHRVIWHGATGDPHAGRVDAGLASIAVDEVLAQLRALRTAGYLRNQAS